MSLFVVILMLPPVPLFLTHPCLTDRGEKRNLYDRQIKASFYFSETHCMIQAGEGVIKRLTKRVESAVEFRRYKMYVNYKVKQYQGLHGSTRMLRI